MGAAVAAFTLPTDQVGMKWAFAGMAIIGFTVMVLLFKIQKHGMFTTILGWVRKPGFKLQSLVSKEEKLRELDDQIYEFYNRDQKHFRWCTFTYLIGWMFDTMEIMVVALLLGAEMAWHHAFAMEAFITHCPRIQYRGARCAGHPGVRRGWLIRALRLRPRPRHKICRHPPRARCRLCFYGLVRILPQ